MIVPRYFAHHSNGIASSLLKLSTVFLSGGAWVSKDAWGNYYETRINFVCASNVSTARPTYIGQSENVYTIQFLTPVVCKARVVDCVAYSDGEKYDLNPLTLQNGTL